MVLHSCCFCWAISINSGVNSTVTMLSPIICIFLFLFLPIYHPSLPPLFPFVFLPFFYSFFLSPFLSFSSFAPFSPNPPLFSLCLLISLPHNPPYPLEPPQDQGNTVSITVPHVQLINPENQIVEVSRYWVSMLPPVWWCLTFPLALQLMASGSLVHTLSSL